MPKVLLAAALAAIATPLAAAAAPAQTAVRVAFQPTRFSVIVQGRGPDVIFIPGLSSTRDVWAASAERLRATHRVHLVQLKGFGEAAGPNAIGPVLQPFVRDLAAYIRANRLQPAIVGHSMGGLAAMMVGVQYPDLPAKLLVVDALPFIGPIFGAADLAAITPRAVQMRAMIMAQAGAMTPDFASRADCPATLPTPAKINGNMTNSGTGACMVKHGARSSDLRVVAQAIYDDMLIDLRPRMKELKAPVTMLYPQDDRLFSRVAADTLYAEAFTGTATLKLVRIAGSYHFIMQDQPQLFADELDRFLR